MIPKSLKLLASGIAAASISAGASAATLGTFDGTTVTVGGFVKLDAIVSSYSDGSLAAGNIGRDFYIPSLTPTSDGSADSSGPYVDFHARQSRINLGTSTELDGHTLKTFVEMDFMVTSGGDERISNSYSPRVRHAFLSYDKWLFGQTWSTFQNTGALPETADFVGNTDFGIFVRQAQIRYTSGSFQFAIENPESTITPYGGGGRIVSDDNGTPDLVARYNLKAGGLDMAFAVLLRQLALEDGAMDETTSSTGFSASGKYTFGNKSDIRFGFNTGSGMGRYIGLNVVNGAVINADGELEAIDSTAMYAAYRWFWSPKVRSTISYSAIEIDNDIDLTGAAAIDTTSSVRANVFYSPVPKLSLGWEIALATKELENGDDGSMDRFQFSAKLAF